MERVIKEGYLCYHGGYAQATWHSTEENALAHLKHEMNIKSSHDSCVAKITHIAQYYYKGDKIPEIIKIDDKEEKN